jgi:hypothetical protein
MLCGGEGDKGIPLSPSQLNLVKQLGFCDPGVKWCDGTDDGVISLDGQTSEYRKSSGYEQAFRNLAALGGAGLGTDDKVIDAFDILALYQDPAKLGQLIEMDPAYDVFHEGRALELNEREICPAISPGLAPRHVKRFVTYIQLALKQLVNPNLKVTGKYDKATYEAVVDFRIRYDVTPYSSRYARTGLPKTTPRLGYYTVSQIASYCRGLADGSTQRKY